MKKALLLAAVLGMAGCTDADKAQLLSLGSHHKVTCYSGTAIIYQGESSGNVSNETNFDGWYWNDLKTGKLVESSGTCLIEQE